MCCKRRNVRNYPNKIEFLRNNKPEDSLLIVRVENMMFGKNLQTETTW